MDWNRMALNAGAAACLGLAAAPAMAAAPAVSVMVGAEAELNACTSVGHVSGLAPGALLAVRAAPADGAAASGRLRPGHLVWICQQRGPDGAPPAWLGIVYQPGKGAHDRNGVPPSCGVDRPLRHPHAYRGPCRAGWVPAKQITFDAG